MLLSPMTLWAATSCVMAGTFGLALLMWSSARRHGFIAYKLHCPRCKLFVLPQASFCNHCGQKLNR